MSGIGKRALLAAAMATPALAQGSWPNRPIRFVSPFAPGGPQEVPARIIAEHLSQRLGQAVVIDSRPGAGSAVGTQYVARETDGHTFLITTTSFATLPAILKDPGFDAFADLVPVTLISESSLLLACRSDAPFADFAALLAAAKARPGRISVASAGIGSSTHLAMALLMNRAGIELLHVPYRGVTQSLTALLAGDIDIWTGDPSIPAAQLQEGRLRPLAVTTAARSPALPGVPAIGEAVPGYAVPFWFALLGGKATPPEAVAVLMREMAPLRAPDSALARRMAGLGATLLLTGPEALTARLRQEVPQWRQVAAAAGITPE
ncbi:tripartite tricarboxylate transporter substrate-binding protein [Paracraurococcus lichenis]|uniref:Tripartite tricarboxylate transporter substrate-binding protein n=1 Tax=Paracraurococcus lichenis TaxID=3064888 RepID=A0ABT9E0F2_9PROT|nr:tripartite tricarboxylate transporter substrate-binding protein [Paracraurococcus sp. LOR1-02]MDO9709485.1 tripartite tricarboxylate transporter substrate-binding protein [Paracraurococcus sp. LOR1-02]